MAQHISIRVPWHDHGWDGTVCEHPCDNNSCLRLKNISENRDDQFEKSICGECMQGYEDDLPCLSEGAAFMNASELICYTVHPYKKTSPKTHSHFQETELIYPAYSFPARPFAWLMKSNIENLIEQFGIQYNPDIEPTLSFTTNWIQEADNHKAIFEYFYQDVKPDESMVIAYAKQVPFVEDSRRVVIAIGHVKDIVPAKEHNHTDEKPLRSMIWETMIKHSIREDHKDGFVIPYKEMMEYAEEHPEFDMSTITVFAPDDAFEEFSYASEHVSYDAVIDVLLSCIKSFKIINDCLDEDYSNVLEWLNARLEEVWEDRGAFPGLGAMLTAVGLPLGVVVAKELKERIDNSVDIWDAVDETFVSPNKYLSDDLADNITPIIKKTWKSMTKQRRKLFKLLSRFSINVSQAQVLFYENEREKRKIFCTDLEIIENPYVLYEQTRLKIDELFISVRKVDRAVFPVASILEKYPMEEPSKLSSDNDARRVRALAVWVMESAALNGHTYLPCKLLVDRIHEVVLEPECTVTIDILSAIEDFMEPHILKREMKDGTEYYKLVRLNKFDDVIEKRINKRLNAPNRLEVNANWRELLDIKFDGKPCMGKLADEREEKARQEKAAVLKELAESRISVLVGDAGTGKTTVLSVLCEQEDIKAAGVLLLAPTGKATVRLLESMGDFGKDFTAKNVAQFLCSRDIGGFIWEDMRYELPKVKPKLSYGTAIIDEASMLTEEMFGALLEALGKVPRIIFVGDPNQLPPIGSGRPFVDLVCKLSKSMGEAVFPRVATSYGELTVNRRQESDQRSDVLLSKLFTRDCHETEEGLLADILKGNSPNIEFLKWDNKDDLEEKLLDVVIKITGMKNADDIRGFNASLGATAKGNYDYFNVGCANYADNWQVLAPVRNMPQGVMNINRMFHMKYRENFISLSNNWGKYKRIAKKLGPEGIVYGDKVINVQNGSREGWPDEKNPRNYVANGEIGIACGDFSTSRKNDYMHVEFSTQKEVLYSFDKRDFDDESGSANLELAYALTVHKSQGSQFNTVILVLAAPCLIISREMLYTALTRQQDKIYILYNKEPYELLRYTSDANSDIASRFTDLFADVFADNDKKRDVGIYQKDGNFYDEKLIHCTARGDDMVRSKSEVIIADALFHHGLDYEYESVLELEGRTFRPDFKIEDGDTGVIWYWEHCGMMTDIDYKRRWENKKAFYAKNGIVEGKNLIVTEDDPKGGLNSHEIEEIINKYFD